MSKNLVLFGMMGAGKSTVAVVVGERLGREVAETDHEVERIAGRSIAEIFAADGEAAFRRLERLAVEGLVRRADRVISVGGGAVLDAENVVALKSSGVLIELRAPLDTLVVRLAGEATAGEAAARGRQASAAAATRPLLSGTELRSRVGELLEMRAPRYAQVADHSVDASDPPVDVAENVLHWAASVPGVLTQKELARVSR